MTKEYFIETKYARKIVLVYIALVVWYSWIITEDFIKTIFLILLLSLFYVLGRMLEEDGFHYTKKKYVKKEKTER